MVMALAATGTGGVAAFVMGAAWSASGLPRASGSDLLALVVLADLADGVHLASGRFPPPSVRRQVPQLWGRIFAPATAATLYGARLGVGPLTVLNTWLWWAAAVAGASAGPGWSVAVGASFGLARVIAMVVVAERVRSDMASGMASVQRADRSVGVLAAVGAGLVALVAAA